MKRPALALLFSSFLFTSAAFAQEAPTKVTKNSGVAVHAYGGASVLRPSEGDPRGAGVLTIGIGGGGRSVFGYGDLTFVGGTKSEGGYMWTRLGPTIEGRIRRFVFGGGMAVGLLAGWDRHEYFSGGMDAFMGVDLVRFDSGALRLLVDLRGDALRETSPPEVRAPSKFEVAAGTLLLGYRTR